LRKYRLSIGSRTATKLFAELLGIPVRNLYLRLLLAGAWRMGAID
jgi:hypothetical protein